MTVQSLTSTLTLDTRCLGLSCTCRAGVWLNEDKVGAGGDTCTELTVCPAFSWGSWILCLKGCLPEGRGISGQRALRKDPFPAPGLLPVTAVQWVCIPSGTYLFSVVSGFFDWHLAPRLLLEDSCRLLHRPWVTLTCDFSSLEGSAENGVSSPWRPMQRVFCSLEHTSLLHPPCSLPRGPASCISHSASGVGMDGEWTWPSGFLERHVVTLWPGAWGQNSYGVWLLIGSGVSCSALSCPCVWGRWWQVFFCWTMFLTCLGVPWISE